MAIPTRTVATPADVSVFSITPSGGSLENFITHLKSVKLKEEVAELRVDGICDADEDVEPGKKKWSVDVSKKAALTGSALRPGNRVILAINTGSIVRYGYAMVSSREDDAGSDSDTQSVAFTLKGKGGLSLTPLS